MREVGLPLDHDNHQGKYGEAFVRVVAAAAGLVVAKPDPDYDGINFFLHYPRAAGTPYLPQIDVQVKSARNPEESENHWRYRLKARHFNELAGISEGAPRFLFLVIVPPNVHEYIEADAGCLRLLWELTDDGERYEALVPRDPQVRDYVVRTLELLQILATVENRSNSQILRDLTRTDADIQYVQTYPRTPPGTIPVSDAAAAVEGVRELMIAGAYGVVSPPSLVLPSRKARQVEDFPRLARIGPSTEGSYVISVEIPLDTEDSLFPVGPPFGRRVLLRLYDTIRTARDAANEAMEIPS